MVVLQSSPPTRVPPLEGQPARSGLQAARIRSLQEQLQATAEALEDESTHHQADMASIHQKLIHLTSAMQVCSPCCTALRAVKAILQSVSLRSASNRSMASSAWRKQALEPKFTWSR